ncbi:HAD family phosphatase [Ancylobacter sp. 6x-1]|uniref:HAD family phosphatase n=1 Tax=Ancylobacter crimeensis TaxID=2579147 RepID=A0ABT0D9D9_9HYPH|nr:HAD family phosphatase [Ancylobacter crimeensis]MCK0196571.1 HAD family phosphatase [Ancylobacter crimeensis]
MRQPSLVLFDMDDVLCISDKRVRSAHLARLSGGNADRIYSALWDSGFSHEALQGGMTNDVYLTEYGRRIGYPITRAEWIASRRASMTPIPEVLALVEQVRRRARVAVLTNNVTLVSEHIDELFPELVGLFGADIFASAALGVGKPEAACFHVCLAALGVAPGEALFVDDLAVNIAGAQAAGLDAVQFTTPRKLASALAARGLVAPEVLEAAG